MQKIVLCYLLPLLNLACVYSQNIEFGQDAQTVKAIVEYSTTRQNKENPHRKPNEPFWSNNSIYNDGILDKVILCFENQVLIDFKVRADYCTYYNMKNGKLNYIIKEFRNISLQRLTELHIEQYSLNKIEKYFFTNDLEHYYTFYLSKENLACAEYRKTSFSDFDNKTSKEIQVLKEKHIIEKTKIDSIATTPLPLERKLLFKAKPNYACHEEGSVIVEITVNPLGKVIDAKAIKRTSAVGNCLIDEACKAAKSNVYERVSTDANQKFTINYNFRASPN